MEALSTIIEFSAVPVGQSEPSASERIPASTHASCRLAAASRPWQNARVIAPSPSLADPDGADAIVAAVQSLQGTLLGTVATTVAVVAVAAVGFLMLGGRIDWRRGATVIAGCFVLFGATSIVAGIRGGVGAEPVETPAYVPPPTTRVPPAPQVRAAPGGNNPYAGASVPPG